MSLQLAAQHLASKGRGKDSRLVHMTPNELKGLQSLAKAKGGSLTINPETGLPEAGFLEDVLPIAATAATMAFFPAAAPALGGMFGASGALATGLGAGLMAGGYNLLGQALGGQQLNLGKALTSGAITGVTAGALQGLGAYTPTSDVATQTAATSNVPIVPAQIAAENQSLIQSAINPATGLPYAETSLAGSSAASQAAATDAATKTGAGLTGGQKLALGLGGVGALSLLGSRGPKLQPFQPGSAGQIRPYEFTATPTMASPYQSPYSYNSAGLPVTSSSERQYFDMGYTALPPYNAAQGGLMMAYGGPVERMSAMDQGKGMYPQGMMDKTYYATPTQRPASMEVVRSDYDTPVNPITGVGKQFAAGGLSDLGSYSDGGRLLKGPGDGMSDNIPAMIGKKQPARLADGEFVVPADVVSHLGNGSTDAGAKRLYAMMDKVRKARTGNKKQGKEIKAEKYLPA